MCGGVLGSCSGGTSEEMKEVFVRMLTSRAAGIVVFVSFVELVVSGPQPVHEFYG